MFDDVRGGDAAGSTPPSLEGLIVADFSRVLAGPLATMLLGDLGATVIKIERPDGGDDTRAWGPPFVEGVSTYFLALNRNKRSIRLDLAVDDELGTAVEIVRHADILVENFRPGTMAKFGLDYREASTLNPGLVYCSLSGFGTGPGATLPGYDSLAQAVGGLMSITGEADGDPTRVGVALVDVIMGLLATLGILAALRERDRSGRGQHVEINLLSSLLMALVNQASGYVVTGEEPQRLGSGHPSVAPHGTFQARDGKLFIIAGNDRQFAGLCNALSLPELVEDERYASNAARVRNGASLNATLNEAFAREGVDGWIDGLRANGVPSGPVNGVGAAFELAQDLGLEPIVHLGPPGDRSGRQVANPIKMSLAGPSYRLVPPALGADTGMILDWLRSARQSSFASGDADGVAAGPSPSPDQGHHDQAE